MKAIVAEALNQNLSERDRFSAEACGSDAGLLGEVRRLLEQETLPGSGQMVGHYRIDSKIGEGGMGVLAEGRRGAPTIGALPGDGEFFCGTWSPDGTTIPFPESLTSMKFRPGVAIHGSSSKRVVRSYISRSRSTYPPAEAIGCSSNGRGRTPDTIPGVAHWKPARCAPGRDFTAGMPERLFRHPDLLLAVPADAPPTAIRDVQNWYAEFKDQQSPR